MSLDVYLRASAEEHPCTCRCGHTHTSTLQDELYSANITHNLGKMAREAGIYEALWRPEEVGYTRAAQLIEPLRAGLERMKADPEHYKQFDSPNGWGLYKHFVPWVERYLEACERFPEAEVYASR